MSDTKISAIDIFAGPGGLGEGFANAGFDILVSVERDEYACRTLKTRVMYRFLRNLKRSSLYWNYVKGIYGIKEIYSLLPEVKKEVELKVLKKTISSASQSCIVNEIEKRIQKQSTDGITVLLGGPPCQLYSLIGRARYSKMKRKFYGDPRRRLFNQYLYLLKTLKPKVFVFENVPGILSAQFKRYCVLDILKEEFDRADYQLAKPNSDIPSPDSREYVLNSLDYGVPQIRKRLFLIGFQKGLEDKLSGFFNIYHTIQNFSKRIHQNTVKDAIADLPEVNPGCGNDRWLGKYEEYSKISSYALRLRRESEGVLNHRARTHMPDDIRRYQYFIETHRNGSRSVTLEQLLLDRPDLKPAHKNLNGFTDRFKVQRWNRQASTIMAHLAKDGHYYIHPDIKQCRSFTVREAARCQSFPDNYFFEGPRTEQFKQVGNAVPPLLAEVIGRTIIKLF